MKTDEIRIGDLRPADRYRDFDSDEWRTVTKIDQHGDTTLLWLKDGTETAEDFEYVIEVQLPRATGEPWCNHDPAALTDVNVLRCECGATIDPDSGDVIGEGEAGPDAVALGITEQPYDPVAQALGARQQAREIADDPELHKDCRPSQHDPRIPPERP